MPRERADPAALPLLTGIDHSPQASPRLLANNPGFPSGDQRTGVLSAASAVSAVSPPPSVLMRYTLWARCCPLTLGGDPAGRPANTRNCPSGERKPSPSCGI